MQWLILHEVPVSHLLSLVLSAQKGIKGPSIHLGWRSEGSGACVAHSSAKNILF
jgi:hypothetical protein